MDCDWWPMCLSLFTPPPHFIGPRQARQARKERDPEHIAREAQMQVRGRGG